MSFDTKQLRQAVLFDEIIGPDGTIESVERYWLIGQYFFTSQGTFIDDISENVVGKLISTGIVSGASNSGLAQGSLL